MCDEFHINKINAYYKHHRAVRPLFHRKRTRIPRDNVSGYMKYSFRAGEKAFSAVGERIKHDLKCLFSFNLHWGTFYRHTVLIDVFELDLVSIWEIDFVLSFYQLFVELIQYWRRWTNLSTERDRSGCTFNFDLL